jgi:ParB-like chromosome segregation protein Spo0J
MDIKKVLDRNNVIRKFDLKYEDDKELFEDIKVNGIKVPIIVNKAGAFYRINDGSRRFAVAQILGMTEVPTNKG